MLADSHQMSSLLHRDFQSFVTEMDIGVKRAISDTVYPYFTQLPLMSVSGWVRGKQPLAHLWQTSIWIPQFWCTTLGKKWIACYIVPRFKREYSVKIHSKHRPQAPLKTEKAGAMQLWWARAATGVTAYRLHSFSSLDILSAHYICWFRHSIGDVSVFREQLCHEQGAINMHIKLQVVSPNRHDVILGEIPVQFRDCHLRR